MQVLEWQYMVWGSNIADVSPVFPLQSFYADKESQKVSFLSSLFFNFSKNAALVRIPYDISVMLKMVN